MICECCGKDIKCVEADTFDRFGSDSNIKYPIVECEEEEVYFDTTANWTGYKLSEKEKTESIHCPSCGKFPFKNPETQVYNFVRVVMFKESENK